MALVFTDFHPGSGIELDGFCIAEPNFTVCELTDEPPEGLVAELSFKSGINMSLSATVECLDSVLVPR